MGEVQLAGSGNLVGELELLVQGRVIDVIVQLSGNLVGELELGREGDVQLAGSGNLVGELELGREGDVQLAGSGNLVGELELGREGDVQLAGSGNLVGELELLVQCGVSNRHLASLALLCRGYSLEVSQRVPVGLRQHVSEVRGGALFLDNLAQRLQDSEKN